MTDTPEQKTDATPLVTLSGADVELNLLQDPELRTRGDFQTALAEVVIPWTHTAVFLASAHDEESALSLMLWDIHVVLEAIERGLRLNTVPRFECSSLDTESLRCMMESALASCRENNTDPATEALLTAMSVSLGRSSRAAQSASLLAEPEAERVFHQERAAVEAQREEKSLEELLAVVDERGLSPTLRNMLAMLLAPGEAREEQTDEEEEPDED